MDTTFTIHVDLAKLVSDATFINSESNTFTFVNKYRDTIHIYSTMKNLVNDNGTMVSKTGVPCWWCRLQFDTAPFGCPIRKTIIDDTVNYYTCGVFCSLECTKSYILDNMRDYGHCLNILSCMAIDMFKYMSFTDSCETFKGIDKRSDDMVFLNNRIHVKERPCWKLLKDNGGPLSRDEYFSTGSIYIPVIGKNIALVPVSNDYQQYNENI